jgi:hypothetical protein
MAAAIPSGAQINSANAVSKSVFIIDGSIDTFSELYSHANRSGVKYGTPLIRIYTMIKPSTKSVKAAAKLVNIYAAKDAG